MNQLESKDMAAYHSSNEYTLADVAAETRKIADLAFYSSMMADAELIRERAFGPNGKLVNVALLLSANRERREIMAHAANNSIYLDSLVASADLWDKIGTVLVEAGPEMSRVVLTKLRQVTSGKDKEVAYVSVDSNTSTR